MKARALVAPLLALIVACAAAYAAPADPLLAGFLQPPPQARPLVWWHWTNGNVTQAAITADLEAMQRVGIGGVQLFDVDVGNPLLVPTPVDYMTPRWLQLLAFTARECKRLGLSLSVHSSAGWSESGGPWVRPADGMRKLVWSETQVTGPTTFTGTLPSPPRVFGPYGNLAREKMGTPAERWPAEVPEDYTDEYVLAYPTPAGRRFPGASGTLSGNVPNFDPKVVTDGDLNTRLKLPFTDAHTPVMVDVHFDDPFVAQALSLAAGWIAPLGELQSSQDGKTFTKVIDLPRPSVGSRPIPKTVTFTPVKAKHFRLVFLPRTSKLSFEFAELQLFEAPRVHRFEDKAGFGLLPDVDIERGAPAVGVDPKRVVDLTKRFKQGKGVWQVPAGSWTLVRVGHAATGMKNRPATAAGLGLEVDKLNAQAVRRYISTFLSRLQGAGVFAAGSMNGVLMDSWEAEHQNWTPGFMSAFRKRRGYDPLPFLPAMTGAVIVNAEASDRFLWDVRRTIADELSNNHYGVVRRAVAARGLRLEAEAVGQGMPMIADQLQARGRTDVPMGEFWVPAPGAPLQAKADCKEAASAAHIYGKQLVGAEAFSSGPDVPAWSQTPRSLKAVGDLHFATGINRLSLHQFTLQPDDTRKPGLTLKEYGSPFNRLNTWWDASGAWFTYLSRAQFLLQQGWFVGDVVYLYGEGAPATVADKADLVPAMPPGRDYDFVNTEALLNHARMLDGVLNFPGARGFRILVMPPSQVATPALLLKLRGFVRQGLTVVGPRPLRSPSLRGDAEVKALAAELWGPCEQAACEHKVGRGRVITGATLEAVLQQQSSPADIALAGETQPDAVATIHRQTKTDHIYFLANLTEFKQILKITLRAQGSTLQMWNAETGAHTSIPFHVDGATIRTDVALKPLESVFLLVRQGKGDQAAGEMAQGAALEVAGPWDVEFTSPFAQEASHHETFARLQSLSKHANPLVHHFAGNATYRAQLQVPRSSALTLDLGHVHDVARVRLNGSEVATLWNQTGVDVTNFVHAGRNELEIIVSVGWPNRLIGDAALPPTQRKTWTTFNPYTATSPLREAGLLGPVRLIPR
ncbi:MAG: glycosyl hydrolase [Deltaproteobacteria bacterium]|nr:glycosyl hydrolase [Deltaproteobacteria bacterium]